MSYLRPLKSLDGGVTKIAAAILLLASLGACSGNTILGSQPEPDAASPPAAEPEPPLPAPPVDIAGRWQLSAAAGGACMMNFGANPGAAATAASAAPQGTIAPEGGCPGNFFTSRKWTFEDGKLIIRDFKGRQLAQLSYLGAHFEGKDASGGALTLSKQL